ncbi:hypothetical protein TYRP_004766 [Tyrophagus putrescentiae]|nr:hypothetical protein TYRP_004766 [Tyrophagus putrescentiae]
MTLPKLTLCLLALVQLGFAIKEPKVAPYVDVTRMSADYLVKVHHATGLSAVTLAFVLGGTGGCDPHWGGESGVGDPKVLTPIKEFQKIGGKVILATGGAMGPYLEASCSSPAALAAAYKKALNTVGTHHLDIDIEASISLENMNSALKILQGEMPDLTISYTLMIQGDDYGLTDALGVEVLKSAAKHGLRVDIVNAMTMEFGSKLASWGDAVIAAGESVVKQMQLVWPSKPVSELYAMLGVTPMIGRNYNGKIFDISHAKELVAWAKQKKIGHLAYWSLGRDKGCAGGAISPDCSSIAQSELEFAKIFQSYAGTTIPDHFTDPTPKPDHHTTHHHGGHTDHPVTRKPQKIDCSIENAHYPHETDCDKYYWCFNGTPHLETCGAGTVWDPKIGGCNFPKDAHRTDCK